MIEIANEFLRKIFLDLGLEKGQAWLEKRQTFWNWGVDKDKISSWQMAIIPDLSKKKKKMAL